MVEDSIPKALWKEIKDTVKQRNGQILLVREGGMMLPSTPLQPKVNIQGPLPLLPQQKIRLFIDWSSIGSRSPPVIPPPQSVPIGDTSTAPGIEGIHEMDHTAPEPSQPISQESYMGTVSGVVQEDLPTTPKVCQQPLERSSIPGERRMTDMRTNASDVVIEPTRSGLRPSNREANTQTSIPIVNVLLPSGPGYHITIPHVNISILGYEPDPQRTSGMRSPSMRTQEVSTVPQLDGPGSLPVRDYTRGRVGGFLHQIEQDSSQGDTYVQRAPTTRRRKYPGGDSNSDGYRRPH